MKKQINFKATVKKEDTPSVSKAIDLEKLTAGDEDPFYFSATFINSTDGEKLSKKQINDLPNRFQFSSKIVESLAGQFSDSGKHGYEGHQSFFGGGFQNTAVYWIGGKYKDGSAQAFGYVPDKKIAENIQRGFAINNPVAVSMSVELDYDRTSEKFSDGKIYYNKVKEATLSGIDLISSGHQADKNATTTEEVNFMDETAVERIIEEKLKVFSDSIALQMKETFKALMPEDKTKDEPVVDKTLEKVIENFKAQIPDEHKVFRDLIGGDSFDSVHAKFEDIQKKIAEFKKKKELPDGNVNETNENDLL